jgi:hypothetical protein
MTFFQTIDQTELVHAFWLLGIVAEMSFIQTLHSSLHFLSDLSISTILSPERSTLPQQGQNDPPYPYCGFQICFAFFVLSFS